MMNKTYNTWMWLFYLSSSITFILYLWLMNFKSCLNLSVVKISDYSISISLNLSYYNLLFIFTVLMIFSSVFHYSLHYMKEEKHVKRFLINLLLFAISMIILISSGNLFTTLIGWDGLGVTSMLLIMYYPSDSSLKASMHTFVINRLGDCFFLIFIVLMMCQYSSMFILQTKMSSSNMNIIVLMLLMLLSITKSAQFPFSSWLTKAMEAPTPVSSLVHSSTLVTAGIFILFLYHELWMEKTLIKNVLMIVSLSTLFMASIAGTLENDFKKIIAYSTLSQLGFIVFTLSLNLFDQGFLHLIMHAYFKALMFMCAGYIIHSSSGWQDIRMLTNNYSCSPMMIKMMVVSMFSLSGFPFLSGFYSKDLVIDSIMANNYSITVMILLITSFALTVIYTFRFCWFITKSMKSTSYMSDKSLGMQKSMIILLICSCSMGSTILWTFSSFDPSFNCPKILLSLLLMLVVILFWMSPSLKKNHNYEKSMMYTYIVMKIIVNKSLKFFQKLVWNMDLLGLMGKSIKVLSNNTLWVSENFKTKKFLSNYREYFLSMITLLMVIYMLI
uniref:NADH dehydrogenase subunit 5 n=1 Tax=Piagetiella africana TaxID=2965260 RepID=UPI00286B77D1|nr:NADH dehydrogenase subunit 5 [Piagetiella africana]WKF19581.1 NADH dehydrogenase subunit 5 [Piagetiella africana]